MKNFIALVSIASLSFLCLASCNDGNGQPVPNFIVNGDFETGDLTGWTGGGINEGSAFVVEEGSCFSGCNPRGVAMKGIFSTNVRGSGALNSIGILTSDPFIAGNAIRFIALSENCDGVPTDNPVTLEVMVLDDMGSILIYEIIDTNIVTLIPRESPDCSVVAIRDGALSTHIIDTSDLAGDVIRIEFHQRTNVEGLGLFTLIDEVEVVD